MTSITNDPLEVLLFMKKHISVLGVEYTKALGFKRDGKIVFGVLYQYWTAGSVWCHMAKDPECHTPFNREFLRLGFEYPFVQVGVKQLLCMVDASNYSSRNLCEHFGYTTVATVPCAGFDGGDMLIYRLRKEDCRFIRRKENCDESLACN